MHPDLFKFRGVDSDRVRGHEEWIAILRLQNKIDKIKQDEKNWHRDFNQDCFIIADHIDFLLYKTFQNHERKVA
jgi:hypothetical protein